MFDIGFWELVLISVVALVVLGPERLPVAIRSVTKFVRTAKSMANSVKDELSQELKIQELQDNLRKAEQMGMKDLSPELQSSIEELKKAAQDVQRPYAKNSIKEPSTQETSNLESVSSPEHVSESLESEKKDPTLSQNKNQ
ncbi:Sec-independent protein translocase protein TatB [Vibrio casei]|uniref:Sec-independent protein translocase protein TatB n=1 Tax=Vibrio casei TaxID=673372 RepID=A0A368LK93_9VIBR|nr:MULTISPECIES: Sec-independent protein translocase protein TatB [Vibrio]RCS72258.1 Sec-independent protein translocase subunit TatB [Vibrio casei]SJN15465.1 Twin-arginine translocation protein TatB [Vibrio casei]HBV76446.1 Sec-independent protein translocase subunit TatB [Vibrio sp.]